MKTWIVQTLMVMIGFAFLAPGAQALVEADRVQIGRYEMKYSSEVPTVDVLEILPGKRFRFWDYGTQKAVFIFEGHFSDLKKQADGSYQLELQVERDGRILKDKVVSRTTSEFNLRLKKMNLKIYEKFASTTVIMERWHAYREGDFWTQTRMADYSLSGDISNFDFIGMPIDY